MPNFGKVFQDEVRRLARKECKQATDSIRSELSNAKKTISSLRKQVNGLERELRRARKAQPRAVAATPAAASAPDEPRPVKARFSGKSIRQMRDKLGLTQAEFAHLAGVSGQSVYQWERRDDQLRLREATRDALVAMRSLGKREARRLLDES